MKKIFDYMLPSDKSSLSTDIGLLLIRVGFASFMLFGHGLGKLTGYAEKSASFPDPLGIGSPASMALVVFAEFFASVAILFGFLTRLAVVPLIITMAVAGLIIHSADPFNIKELAVLYLLPFVALFFTGPGRFSLDYIISSAICKCGASNNVENICEIQSRRI
ncbi:MAG: DoxX family protein [bacterium]